MIKNKSGIILVLLLLAFNIGFAQQSETAHQKLAQTGCQFLSVGIDGRNTGMAEAVSALPAGSASLFYNPAGMAFMPDNYDGVISWNKWIADINYYSGSFAFKPSNGLYGTFGLSFLYVNYGDFQWTMVDKNSDKGYFDLGNFSPFAFAAGVGYSIQLSDKFSIGGHVKYVYQKLGNSVMDDSDPVKNWIEVMAFDFGTLYYTGFKSLAFGMNVRNFSQEVKYQSTGFQLPLTFKLGLSIDAFDFLMEKHQDQNFLVSIDAVHNRDYPEQINLGFEYGFQNMVFLRGGYMFNNDEHGLTAGIGVKYSGIGFDAGYAPFGIFDKVLRLGVRYTY